MRKRQMILGAAALALTAGVFSAPAAFAQPGETFSALHLTPAQGHNGQSVEIRLECYWPRFLSSPVTSEAIHAPAITRPSSDPGHTLKEFTVTGKVDDNVKPGKYSVSVNCGGSPGPTTATFEVLASTATKPPTTTTKPPTTSTKPKAPQVAVKPKAAPETGGGGTAS